MITLNKKTILEYAMKYDEQYSQAAEAVEKKMKQLLQNQRYLTRDQFVQIGLWKSRRPQKHYLNEENDDLTVKEVTQFCFSTKSCNARIKTLLTLKGVSWPLASTILHFAFPDKFPIMDFRVVWSLGWKKPPSYKYIFWQEYCDKVNNISKKLKLPIRTVEKALWRYSKDHQK